MIIPGLERELYGMAVGDNKQVLVAPRDSWWPDHAVFNATKDELKAMPEFKYST